MAFFFAAGEASVDFAVFSAVRSAARCDRLRAVAALVLRMFFFADAILGTTFFLFRWGAPPRAPARVATSKRGRGIELSQGSIVL